MKSTTRALAVLAFALAPIGACSHSSSPAATPAVTCDSTASVVPLQSLSADDVGVYVETGGDPGLEIVRADMAKYLGRMWGMPGLAVSSSAPDFAKKATVWLSTGADAKARVGKPLTSGYALERLDANGSSVFLVYAPDAADLAFGAYAFLEELGARFFHPKEELVPTFGGPRLPVTLDVTRAPAMASRGLQVHTLHPLDTLPGFNEPSAANLADAELFVDWLVKTGQNYLQWAELSTVNFAAWKPYATEIIDFAHSRGVSVGAVLQIWGGAALQNNYVLVSDETNWQPQMAAALDPMLTLPWDTIELALGEFISAPPQEVIDWCNYAVSYTLSKNPKILVSVQNHVGDYPQLWVPYDGQTVFYYQLPQFADARLGQTVHTLLFFDLYRDWATYGHPNFFLQHDYILKEISTRRVKYFPESAYWISADIDVPLFLPEYIYARWLDIHTLTAELASKKLPPLYGHVMFNSGHEWNYWMTDYLTAKMMWEPSQPLDYFLSKYSSAYGSCAAGVQSDLQQLIQLQTRYLFDAKLIGYLEGEDLDVDLAALIGQQTHPTRVAYEDVLAMSAADRATFEGAVVKQLEAMNLAMDPIATDVAARCEGADATLAPWCDELEDGVDIVALRSQHAVDLYRAVLDRAAGKAWQADYDAALAVTRSAAEVVARREPHYRYGVSRDTGEYKNPTIYGFGYLRPSHTLCYWQRNEQQAKALLDTGAAAAVFSLPTCQD